MTREERIKKLRYLITCMKCKVSGKVCDDNCPTQYDAGNMGEIIENLEEIVKALDQEPTTKSDLAQERYQDLIEHFGDEKVAKTILESRKEFKAWLERLRWIIKRADELARELEQIKRTTKNDLPHCQHTDEEIAKSFIEDVEAVKDQLPTKNDLGVDWDELKRKILMEVDGGTDDKWLRYADVCDRISGSIDDFKADLPSVTPIRPKGHWILTDVEGSKVWQCSCSNCNKDPIWFVGGSENWWLIKNKLPKFCPSCGSDNREVEEE